MPKKVRRASSRGFQFDAATPIYLLAFLIFLSGLLLLGWYIYQYYQGNQILSVLPSLPSSLNENNNKKECQARRVLDGECVPADEVKPLLVGVMVENSADAWPLSGLSRASVVYEVPVEGNIPRFLAIFAVAPSSTVEQVGPVRSARPYYLDWAEEYGALMYMHVGGSPAALDMINSDHSFIDTNEFYRGEYFWRSSDRRAPHNAYTSSDLWVQALAKYSPEKQNDFIGWIFDEQTECEFDCVLRIDVTFYAPTYTTGWQYNTSTQKYERWQNRTPDFDRGIGRLVADTVIIQRVQAKVLDDVGRKEISTVGSGEVVVFRNGKMIAGRWKKDSASARTQWLDSSGKDIPLKAGKIWIEIVPKDNEVEWK